MNGEKKNGKTKGRLRKRFASGFTAALMVFLFILFLFRQPIIEAGVHYRIEQGTGMKAELQHFNFSFRGGEFWINNLKVKNPEGYADEIMFDLSRVHVKQSHRYLFHSSRVDYVMLHFKRVYLIKNEQGELNVSFVRNHDDLTGGEELAVKKLNVILEEIVYKDYTVGKEPVVQVLDAHVREEHLNVRDVADTIEEMIFKGVRKGLMRQVVNLNPSSMLRNFVFDPLIYASSYFSKAAMEAAPLTRRLFSCTAAAVRWTARKTTDILSPSSIPHRQKSKQDTFLPGIVL